MNYYHLIQLHHQLKSFKFKHLPESLDHDTKDRILLLLEGLQDELERGVFSSDSKDVESEVSAPVKHR